MDRPVVIKGKIKRPFGMMDLLMLSATLIWGANYSLIKVALHGWTPMMMNAFRLFLAAASLIIFLKLTGRLRPIEKEDRLRLAIGSVIFLIYQFAYLYGVKGTLTWKASILNGTMPIFVAVFAFLIKDELPSLVVWLAVFFSFSGIIFLMANSIDFTRLGSSEHFLGDLLSLSAAVFWASYTIVMKPLLKKYSPITISSYPIILTAIAFFPFALSEIKIQNWDEISLITIAAAGASGILSIAYGNVIWYFSVKLGGNIRTSIYSNMIPVWAIIIALLFLNESISGMELLGFAFVLLGVGLSKFKIRIKQ
jgi:drug/metabolite transporter (DMT)-like permease